MLVVMRNAATPPTVTSLPPVFPKTQHTLRPIPKDIPASEKSPSRDNREDRGTRQMKTTHNSQTFPHAR